MRNLTAITICLMAFSAWGKSDPPPPPPPHNDPTPVSQDAYVEITGQKRADVIQALASSLASASKMTCTSYGPANPHSPYEVSYNRGSFVYSYDSKVYRSGGAQPVLVVHLIDAVEKTDISYFTTDETQTKVLHVRNVVQVSHMVNHGTLVAPNYVKEWYVQDEFQCDLTY